MTLQREANERRIIFHVDVNTAFLSWSAVKRLREDPGAVDLRTIPSAVGGDISKRHGVITARSLPAKKYGVKTAMPVTEALRLCPGLVLVDSDFSFYSECSRKFVAILSDYTDLVEQASVDEAYMDITGTERLYEKLSTVDRPFPLSVAYSLKDRIRNELGFTVNVGISENMLLAKTASDFEKPDKVHTLFPEELEEKYFPLPIEDLFGCGRASSERLRQYGIKTIGEAAACDEALLKNILGEKSGTYIYESANGRSASLVEADRRDAKSYSNEITTATDITISDYESRMPKILKSLSDSVGRRLRRDGVFGRTVTVTAKTGDFKRHTRQGSTGTPTNSSKKILDTAKRLMHELAFGEKGNGNPGLLQAGAAFRLIGVGVSNLDHGENRQITLFDLDTDFGEAERRETERQNRLDMMEDLLTEKFGKGTVKKGTDF